MKNVLVAALLLMIFSSAAFGDEGKKLREWIDSASWSKGVEYCNEKLPDDLSRRPDYRNVSAEHLARLATYCAALASGQGDELSTGWWWYTAAALQLQTAQEMLPELQKLGLLQTLPAPRNRGAEVEKGKIRLLSGEVVSGTRPRLLAKPKHPKSLGLGAAATEVEVELVIPRDGVPRQPLLVSVRALPVHVFFVYRFLSAWRFEPARVNDEPVDCFYRITISTERSW